VDVGPSFVADGEASATGYPGKGALDDPAMLSEMSAAFNAFSGDPVPDRATGACQPAASIVIALVGVELSGTAAWSSFLPPDGRQRIQKGLKHPAIVDIGTGQQNSQRNTLPISDDVSLRARSPAIRGVWASRFTPLFAAMDALSMQARLQSSRSA